MVAESDDGTLTDGPLVRPMIRLAWPLVVIQLLQVAYNVGDTFWLGRSRPRRGGGAVSLAFPILFLLIAIGGGFTTAGAILIAQHTGAKSGDAGLIAGQTLSFVSLVAVGLSTLGFFFATGPLLAALPADAATQAEIIPLAAGYLRIFFLGLPFLFGFFVFVALMRGYGTTRAPMRVMLVSVVLNLALDPLFIFGVGPFPASRSRGRRRDPHLSRARDGDRLLLAVLYRRGAGYPAQPSPAATGVRREDHPVGGPDGARAVDDGAGPRRDDGDRRDLPAGGRRGLRPGQSTDLAGLPAGAGIGASDGFDRRPEPGGREPRSGGEGGPDRRERDRRGHGHGCSIFAFLFPEPFVSVFVTADAAGKAATIDYGVTYLRFAAVGFAFMGVLQVVQGAFRGAGNTKTALAFAVLGSGSYASPLPPIWSSSPTGDRPVSGRAS